MSGFLRKIFGTQNEREIAKLSPLVQKINSLGPEYSALSDDALRQKAGEIRARIKKIREENIPEIKKTRDLIAASTSDQERNKHKKRLKELEMQYIPEIHDNYALVPQGFEPIPNKAGIAPGLFYHADGKTILLLPGPPREVKAVLQKIEPKFKELFGQSLVVKKTIRTFGIPEVDIQDKLKDVIDELGHVSLLPSPIGVDVVLKAMGKEEKKVREKAMVVLEKARKGKDFAGLAKKYSEGPARSKGGDLGYFPAGRMVKPFEEAAFKLKKGEISDLVRTRFGFHIIKVVDIKDARTKTLDEVREEILNIIIKRKTMELAREEALSLIDQMPYDLDLAQYANEQGLKVKDTDYFSEKERIPGLGGDKKIVGTLFNLGNKEISDLVELQGKLYIFQVTGRKRSYVPDIKVVSDKVKNDVSMFLAAGKAKEAAENYLARIKEGKDWDEVATDKHLKPMKTAFLNRRSSIPQTGYAPDLIAMAFHLNKDNRYPDKIFQNERGVFVIRWEARKGIDQKKYQEEKDKYRSILERVKKKRTFENWLENLKKKADIKILKPVEQL